MRKAFMCWILCACLGAALFFVVNPTLTVKKLQVKEVTARPGLAPNTCNADTVGTYETVEISDRTVFEDSNGKPYVTLDSDIFEMCTDHVGEYVTVAGNASDQSLVGTFIAPDWNADRLLTNAVFYIVRED